MTRSPYPAPIALPLLLIGLARPAPAQSVTVGAEQRISSFAGDFDGELDELDQFGIAVASLGDLNGDGFLDVAGGAHRDGDGGYVSGAVWILFLRGDGTVADLQKISATDGGLESPLHPSDAFGSSLAALGDLNGDGLLVLAVGAPGDDDAGPQAGAVWMLTLEADGTVHSESKILPVGADTEFGASVASLGDLDADGVTDLGVTGEHGAWILFLNPDGSVRETREVPVGELEPPVYRPHLTSLRDLDGDDVPDMAVGGSNSVHVLLLNADGSVRASQWITEGEGGFTGDLDGTDRFGSALTSRGDLDGDGVSDLIVGAAFDDDGGTDAGAVWVLFLNSDGTVSSHQKIGPGSGGFGGTLSSDHFGASVAVLGDQDGSGCDELIVGAPFTDGPAMFGDYEEGAIWVLFLGDTCLGVPCGLGETYCEAMSNSTGLAGRMVVRGSPEVAWDDLNLLAAQLPFEPNLGYFIMGTGMSSFTPPGSEGPICVSPGIKRFLGPAENTTELRNYFGSYTGGFFRDIGTSGPVSGFITAGSTWNFQAWHRDQIYQTSNLTDAVSVTFH